MGLGLLLVLSGGLGSAGFGSLGHNHLRSRQFGLLLLALNNVRWLVHGATSVRL
jgi:hypothetical protein